MDQRPLVESSAGFGSAFSQETFHTRLPETHGAALLRPLPSKPAVLRAGSRLGLRSAAGSVQSCVTLRRAPLPARAPATRVSLRWEVVPGAFRRLGSPGTCWTAPAGPALQTSASTIWFHTVPGADDQKVQEGSELRAVLEDRAGAQRKRRCGGTLPGLGGVHEPGVLALHCTF